MKKVTPGTKDESRKPPNFVRNFSPQMVELLKQHFWCDFSDLNPAMSWDDEQPSN